ncbi:unnamed protein product [Protopolystoma xenopodis]|uniref:Uncharacterized protein n=1 Tax=Protopolystoma xenopodis TaxID=117903 RepID=A0A3S5ARX8_9PLAT|nr:unnamed protein product [Protopolystoma xenopodis]
MKLLTSLSAQRLGSRQAVKSPIFEAAASPHGSMSQGGGPFCLVLFTIYDAPFLMPIYCRLICTSAEMLSIIPDLPNQLAFTRVGNKRARMASQWPANGQFRHPREM